MVLCNPLGDDLIRAHRPFRHLAEELAAAGFPRFGSTSTERAIRPGTSATRPRGRLACRHPPGRRAEIARRSGVERSALLGLKLGGTLAAVAAEAIGGVDALVLWGAHETGDAFVSARPRRPTGCTPCWSRRASPAVPPSTEGQEALGFLLTDPDAGRLPSISLWR